ncbi:hypothetical protein GCM10025760_02940 [Microbacterium yannicii]|uniref:DivIVA domain-containing protein n=1 Tax=Microbacterium yannicii TaxID=671622 RepID=A0ABP9LSM7_9MICO|nr:DivIVA domain-containing protein [Microbacterium yannicii]MCO5953788.1 DivIVA domain-containing protein [Microbacterium yannicii]
MTATESVSITPELLRGVSFAEERHGYARAEVQELLAAAADALEVAWRDNEALTASGVTTEEGEISSRAVLLLSSAQRIADDAVAEAESYAKDLIETARKQYREIIERAQHVAHSIEKQAAAHPGAIAEAAAAQPEQVAAPAVGARPAEPWADRSPSSAFATDDLAAAGPASPDDVVRARQFARMATAQVHSLLESIERELGRLGATPAQTPTQTSAQSSAQPSASPAPALPPVPPAPAAPPSPDQPAADDQPSNDRPWRRGSAGR